MQIIVYNAERVNPFLDDLKEKLMERDLRYKGTDLVASNLMGYDEMQFAVKKAINICRTSHLNVHQHFKAIYVYQNGQVIRDWRLSELARKLVLLNGNSNNKIVAKIQLELLK